MPLDPGVRPPHVADTSLLLHAHHLSVASATDPKVLAGAIAGQARTGSVVAVRAIGAKAVFEMLRAVSYTAILPCSKGDFLNNEIQL